MFYGDWLNRRELLSPDNIALIDAKWDERLLTSKGTLTYLWKILSNGCVDRWLILRCRSFNFFVDEMLKTAAMG